jgi:hypothetical protein
MKPSTFITGLNLILALSAFFTMMSVQQNRCFSALSRALTWAIVRPRTAIGQFQDAGEKQQIIIITNPGFLKH